MKHRNGILPLVFVLLFLLLCGCASGKNAAPTANYQCLPTAEEAAWETVMDAAITGIADAVSRTDEPLDFMARYESSSSGSGNWVVTLIYAGGDIYNVNLDSATAEIHTVVKLPADYLDALDAFYQAGTKASQSAELIYTREN